MWTATRERYDLNKKAWALLQRWADSDVLIDYVSLKHNV
jgi:hypothetical protein